MVDRVGDNQKITGRACDFSVSGDGGNRTLVYMSKPYASTSCR